MEALKRFIKGYGFWLCAGAILQSAAEKYAYIERGGIYCIGGEMFVFPVFISVVALLKQAIAERKYWTTDRSVDTEDCEWTRKEM